LTLLEPTDAQETAEALKAAARDGLAVSPRGGGTKLEWGNRPTRADVTLSTLRMNRIVEHAWADLTVTVEPGCRFAVLQEALKAHGQRVAADPLWPDRATVGGVLSTSDTNALRLRFGGWRDLVIGTTLAFPDGTVAKSGGKVVKNVAGYDLSKLATGAFGTLGVITQAIFRLHPLPQYARTLSTRAPLPEMQRLIGAIQDSRLAHTSLQVRASSSTSSSSPIVDVLFEGTQGGVDAQTRDARALVAAASRLNDASRFDEAGADVWQARQDLWNGAGPIVKVSTLTSRLAGTLELLAGMAGTVGVEWAAVFQATGLGCARFGAEPAAWSSILGELRSAVESDGGSVVILRASDAADTHDVWGNPGDALPLMQSVKKQFDPAGTLNPGRFVGGI
jgi:glycolate oxidase FAD binding subunit